MRRAKRFREATAAKKENSMASMIDVVFLLLIFFLVVNKPIESKTLFKTDMPGKGKPGILKQAPFVIDVTKLENDSSNSWYTVRGRHLRLKDLKPVLSRMAENTPEAPLIINCGPNAKHEKLIHLLDACTEVGLDKFNLINDKRIPFKKAK